MGIAAGMKDIVQDIVSSYDARVAEVKELKKEAKGMLDSFQASHEEMGARLRKELAHDQAKMRGEVRTMRDGFQVSHKETGTQLRRELADYDREIKGEVAGMRQETISDLKEARAAWQELPRRLKKAAAVAEAPPAKEEIPDLEAKLLAAIREHPQGIALTQIAKSLGIAPIVLGRAAKRLVDGGRVRKEGKLYFRAGTERG